ncbi:DOMON domain protein [Ancylostoma ceylanicum]|uniref:DOMON domain protein n=1 Tax=Ancylostoma ceylanicum TaxID=53326 RepID=A0A0D6LME7_9BILA|nr:DOMON domain protein [Ancylostoma ceylanicum]
MLLAALLASIFLHVGRATFNDSTCGRTKGCFVPADPECYQGCNGMKFSWLVTGEGLMEIQLAVDADSADGVYVAVGFSTDDLMGDESVIECSALLGQPLSLKFSYNINATTDPSTNGEPTNWRLNRTGSEFLINSTTSFTDGSVYCAATVNISGAVDAGLLRFDPARLYYLLMANGPTDAKGLVHHVHDVTSPKPMNLSNIVPGFDSDPCGISKGCFLGMFNDYTLNGVAVSYRMISASFIAFELVAPAATKDGVFVAVSFAFDRRVAYSQSIECSSLGNESLSMKFSYNDDYGNNARIAGEETIRDTYFTEESAVFQDGQIYCSAVVNVEGSSVSDKIFKYTAKPYFLILTTGQTNGTGLLPPTFTEISTLSTPLTNNETIRSSYFTQRVIVSADGELYCTALVNVSGWSQNNQVFTYNPTQKYYLLLASGFTNTEGLNQHKHTFISTPRLLAGDDSAGTFNNATCGTKKGCFVSSESNGMAVSYEVLSPESIRFELTMKTTATSSLYLAVGFSKDDKMGLDNVIECSALTGQPLSMKFSYNPALKNARIPGEETIRPQYFQNETATISDGMMYCAATVNVSGWGPSNGQVFTYKENQRYFLLLAAGSAITSGLTQHSVTAVSSSRLLTDYGAQGSTGLSSTVRKRLIKAHAILMILSWFFFVPTAVMFARFLRASWPTMKPGGLLIWFHVHRTFNTIAILLSIASFVCILTANSWEWTGPGSQSSDWGKKHTMVGIFALCLCWIQPFVSAMRCNPAHPRRQFFNWVHRGIGVIAMILATTTVCIAAIHFLSIWPHKISQTTLSLMPLVILLIMSAVFLCIDKFIDVDELNLSKEPMIGSKEEAGSQEPLIEPNEEKPLGSQVQRIRQLLVYVGVIAMASITITLSIFVGIGA